MPTVVQPVTLADFDVMEAQWNSPEGEAIHPTLLLTWPVDYTQDPEMAQSRAKWNSKLQREIFFDDPSARFVKAVDTDTGEILGLARWHYYEHGFNPREASARELNGNAPDAEDTWPEGLNVELHKAFLNRIILHRPEWAGTHPQWYLTTLITRPGHRKKGAGYLLSEWGVKQAQKDGIPAYVESSMQGLPVYEKAGFKTVGKLYFDMPEHLGIPKDKYVTKMAANADVEQP